MKPGRRAAQKAKAVLVRLRKHDSRYGVTDQTLKRLAKAMNLKVSEVVHVALAECAKANLPHYEADDGPLTQREHQRIAELTRATRTTYRETDSLFGPGSSGDDNRESQTVRSVSRAR